MADMEYLALEMRLAHEAIREALGYVAEATDAYTTAHAEAEVKAVTESLAYADKKLGNAERKLAQMLEHIT